MLRRNTHYNKAIWLVKGFLCICLILLLAVIILKANISMETAAEEPTPKVAVAHISKSPEPVVSARPLIEAPVLFSEVAYAQAHSIETSSVNLNDISKAMNTLASAIMSDRYSQEACEQMQAEYSRLKSIADKVESDIATYTTWETEYYYATKVWEYFMQRGYGEVITSAIIGNMMVETSGGSLNLKPSIYDPTEQYYGLCQWALKYHPDIADTSFECQLSYLEETIKKEFKVFGKCYKSDFDFDDFLAIKDPAEAALAFAKVYERCATWSYSPRQRAAVVAFEYFTS